MATVETNTRRIPDRLAAEGWVLEGGTKHAKLFHPDRPGIEIITPRHRTQSPGVGRAMAKDSGWI